MFRRCFVYKIDQANLYLYIYIVYIYSPFIFNCISNLFFCQLNFHVILRSALRELHLNCSIFHCYSDNKDYDSCHLTI